VIQLAHAMPPRPNPRPYLSFPRGTKVPSPRLLLYASDVPDLARRDVDLACALLDELPGASVVVATGAENAARFPPRPHLDVVKVPGMEQRGSPRPLEAERIRRLRQKLLRTLFDVYLPDLVLLDMVGPEAPAEASLLLQRARVFGCATLVGLSHDQPGEGCEPAEQAAGTACARCREKTVREAHGALQELRARRRR